MRRAHPLSALSLPVFVAILACAPASSARDDTPPEIADAKNPVVLDAANFRDRALMATRSDGQLYWQILKGGAPRSEMPAFGPGSDKSWSEEKIWGMVAFLRTLTDAK